MKPSDFKFAAMNPSGVPQLVAAVHDTLLTHAIGADVELTMDALRAAYIAVMGRPPEEVDREHARAHQERLACQPTIVVEDVEADPEDTELWIEDFGNGLEAA